MKITAFCILAEPDKLMYPYIESLRSVSHFADEIVINYAAAEESDFSHRNFEKVSYEKILKLSEEIGRYCKINLILDKNWKHQKDQTYEEVRSIVQNALMSCEEGWFFKFDADCVFKKKSAEKIRLLFDDVTDRINFRRINVINKDRITINNSCEDIYAVNITSLKNKKIFFEIGDIKNWCRLVVHGKHSLKNIEDIDSIPYNYDATFFTKDRIVEFWRRTEAAYSFAEKRIDRYINLSDDEVLRHFINYKKSKAFSCITKFEHPEDIIEKISQINESHWGFNNFSII